MIGVLAPLLQYAGNPKNMGICVACFEWDIADPTHVAEAVENMKRLNRDAADQIGQVGANACTDVAGFSLLGHGHEMA